MYGTFKRDGGISMLDKTEARSVALEYAKAVVEELTPQNIILFGSYVGGTPTADSDIDIAIIFDDFEGDWLETATLLSRLKRKVNLLIEPHLLDESEDVTGFLTHVRQTVEIILEFQLSNRTSTTNYVIYK